MNQSQTENNRPVVNISDSLLANDKHKFLLYDHNFEFIFLWGGRGSAKTSDVVRVLTMECLNESYFRCVVVIKDANRLTDSVYQQFKDFIENNGLSMFFRFKDSTTKIECLNGNKFIFRNGKDAKNAKGLSNYNYALFEEVDQIEKDDYDFIVGTIRKIGDSKFRVYHTFNPESKNANYKDHWLYSNHFSDTKDIYRTFERRKEYDVEGRTLVLNTVYVHSTCLDNPYCPIENIAFYKSFKGTNKAKYNIWYHGRWSNKDTEKQYAFNFDYDIHVKKVAFIPDLPLHYVFDQNFLPYSTCTVWQIVEDKEKVQFRQLDEICLKPPTNDTKSIVNEIIERYDNHPCIIYGDFSGNNRVQRIENSVYTNHYDYIKKNLGEITSDGKYRSYIIRSKVNNVNPPRMPRREIINTIFEGKGKFEMIIHKRCVNSINDWEQGEVDQQGLFDKKKVKGVEIVGHCSDTTFYLLNGTYQKELFKNKSFSR